MLRNQDIHLPAMNLVSSCKGHPLDVDQYYANNGIDPYGRADVMNFSDLDLTVVPFAIPSQGSAGDL